MTSNDSFRPKARRPRGFMDRRGPGLAREREIVERVLKVYESWGFERLETSAFEYADSLGKFLPDQDRPNEGVFALQDDDEQWMALRYDLTAPLARFVAENFDALPKPYRRCAAGPVWRNEKPGPGRFREFWQCDADTVGSASPAADAEMIAMACAALEAVGLESGQFQLRFSSRSLISAVLASAGVNASDAVTFNTVMRAIDKLDRLGLEGVRALLGAGRKDESGDFTKGAGLSETSIATITNFLDVVSGDQPFTRVQLIAAMRERLHVRDDINAALDELLRIDDALTSLRVDQFSAQIDPTIIRGLEYYTGPVFEAQLFIETTDENGKPVRFGSVGGGGRYDDLVARFRGERVPATGFSIGVSRLAAALSLAEQTTAQGPVVILAFDQALMGDYFQMAQELRAYGVAAEVYLGGSGPKAQFKYADKRNAPAAVIMGGDEAAKGEVSVKNLRLGAKLASMAGDDREAYQALRDTVQVTVARGDLVATVKAMLAEAP